MKLGAVLLSMIVTSGALAEDAPDSDCAPAKGITPICGFQSPEDIDVIPGAEALVVGGLGGFTLEEHNGDIRILQLVDQSIQKIFPPDSGGLAEPGTTPWGDPACPGPPTGFAAHGIHVSRNAPGSYTLLVVNHTGREAIEWIELREDAGRFSATWRGCVIVDPELWVNDVAMLPDGGFVATHMMPRSLAATLFERAPNDGNASGYLVEWQPGSGFRKIEGTEGALPNGVQVSADGAVVYTNHYLARQVVAYERATGKRLWTAPVKGAPDNLSITPDGRLLVTAQLVGLLAIRDQCMLKDEPYCGLGFAVYSLDPSNGDVTPVLESAGAPFGGATVAVETGDHIYLGAFAGKRIARIAAP